MITRRGGTQQPTCTSQRRAPLCSTFIAPPSHTDHVRSGNPLHAVRSHGRARRLLHAARLRCTRTPPLPLPSAAPHVGPNANATGAYAHVSHSGQPHAQRCHAMYVTAAPHGDSVSQPEPVSIAAQHKKGPAASPRALDVQRHPVTFGTRLISRPKAPRGAGSQPIGCKGVCSARHGAAAICSALCRQGTNMGA